MYKEFRRKFRFPYELFCDIMEEAYAFGQTNKYGETK